MDHDLWAKFGEHIRRLNLRCQVAFIPARSENLLATTIRQLVLHMAAKKATAASQKNSFCSDVHSSGIVELCSLLQQYHFLVIGVYHHGDEIGESVAWIPSENLSCLAGIA